MDYNLARLLCPWDFPDKNIGVGCHFLLQGMFLTQGSNLGLPHCRQKLYHLRHQGSHLHFHICQGSNFLVSVLLQQKFEVMGGPVLQLSFT